MTTPNDTRLEELRDEISAIDREILDAFNRRLALAYSIKQHKAEKGYSFVDPAREQEMLEAWRAVNPGPLSEEGLEEFFTALVETSKREVRRGNPPG